MGKYGPDQEKDTRWVKLKVKVLNALKKLGAFDPFTAVGAGEVAKASGATLKQVRYYCFKSQASGITKVMVRLDGGIGYSYYLTKLGQQMDFALEYMKARKKKYVE